MLITVSFLLLVDIKKIHYLPTKSIYFSYTQFVPYLWIKILRNGVMACLCKLLVEDKAAARSHKFKFCNLSNKLVSISIVSKLIFLCFKFNFFLPPKPVCLWLLQFSEMKYLVFLQITYIFLVIVSLNFNCLLWIVYYFDIWK